MSVLIDIKCGDPESAAAQYQTAGYKLAHEAGGGFLVEFEAAGHIYRLNNSALNGSRAGEIVPSVTRILKDTGVSVDFEELAGMSERLGRSVSLKRDIGTAVHADAHAFDDDDLDLATVDPLVLPYLEAWMEFRANYSHLQPSTRERLVYHSALGFAGTLDGIFLQGGNDSATTIDERWSVQLVPGRRVPYRVTPYRDDAGDEAAFMAFVTTWYRQAVRRRS